MDGQYDVVDIRHVVLEITEQPVELRRNGVADGVRDIDGCGTGFDGCGDDLGEIAEFGARRVFRRELDVVDQFAGHPDGAYSALDDLFLRHLELVLTMDGTGRHEYVDAMLLGALDSFVDFFDVGGVAARKTADGRSEIAISNCLDRLEIAGGRRREPGFDDVDAELG